MSDDLIINNFYTEKEAFDSSLKYFEGDELAANVFVSKYALRDSNNNLLEDSPEKMHWRIAKEFARIESKKFKKPLTEKEIFGYLDKFERIIPQGSPMFGIGNDYQTISLSNCYVIEAPEDSYGAILKSDQQLVQISKRRGGVGVDLSKLRPAGSPTRNAAISSTGITSWMERYSNSIREVGQGGRRGALMETISIHHPEVLNFITIKNDPQKVTGANISVRLTDEFLTALENDGEYELRFPVDYKERGIKPKISKMVKAREIWDVIINSAWMRAEPGLLFWDSIIKNNAVDCYSSKGFATISTNPCSELPLCTHDSCRLLLQNLFFYVKNPFTKDTYFDFDLFKSDVLVAQRLMDDLVDLEIEKIDKIINKIKDDPEKEEIKKEELELWSSIKQKCINGRRTGLGITGMGDALAALNIKYGSEKSIITVEKIQKAQKLASFESSMEMAKEIGAFPIWDWNLEKDSAFLLQIKGEDPELYKNISKYGRRNIANLTIAPAGSVSILTKTTSGIEPLFKLDPYIRKKKINANDKESRVDSVDQSGDKWQHFEVYHPKVKLWMEITKETDISKSPWYGATANDINWTNRVKLQAAAQKHIDHAISSTINLPETATKEQVSEIYVASWKEGVKGITVYRDNCRSGVLVSKETKKDDNSKITKTIAPKRPKELPCDVHHINFKGKRYYVMVGLLDKDPYELFTGSNDDGEGDTIVPKSIKTGKLVKKQKGKYTLVNEDKEFSCVVTNGHSDDNADALTRLISAALRHGTAIEFIVDQLEKTVGDLTSFTKILGRTLKKYIPDGTKVTGETCPSCKSTHIVRENGCKICKNCGASACS